MQCKSAFSESYILKGVAQTTPGCEKTRLYHQFFSFKNVKMLLSFSSQTNGVTGLFKGIVPRTLRRTLMAALSWTVYEQVLVSLCLIEHCVK